MAIKQSVGTREIDATPTKELFIDMLTRDIELIPAILDLIDNCVDGARKLRNDSSYKGLVVDIKLNKNEFIISDNCGGIDLETAEKYAFRFGRPLDAPKLNHTIGRFGVGMKRALFKIGKNFKITSTTKQSRFSMDVDVDKWALEVDENERPAWKFNFDKVDSKTKHSSDECGTEIIISDLKPDVATDFGTSVFVRDLTNQTRSKLYEALVKKLKITINNKEVAPSPVTMMESSKLTPALYEKTFKDTSDPVSLEMHCGLSESDPKAAGWYIYCNGRLILEADKTSITGWGETIQGINIPEFHGQFNYFRGFVYFDSDAPEKLPWNTTKTGVDMDSHVYRHARQQMAILSRPVIDFLNDLKDEKADKKSRGGEIGPLEKIVEDAKHIDVHEVDGKKSFTFNAPKPQRGTKKIPPNMERITYDKTEKDVDRVKEKLNVSTNREVGEKTFEYFVKAELE